MATAAEISEIIKLYVGYYNRAPDPEGLNFWINAFDNGFSLAAMADDFATQPETLANYPFFLNPNPTVDEVGLFVDAVYGNLFNRVPDAGGREFWSTKIASGEFSVGQAIQLIIEGATTSPDIDVVNNKVAAGRDFFIDVGALPSFTFTQADVQRATDIQGAVTADPASVADAAALTDAYVSDLTSVTINLTTMIEQVSGTSGDDLFIGVLDNTNGDTLQNGDNISGGDGNDTLDLRITGQFVFQTQVVPAGSSIENVEITNQTVGGFPIVTLSSLSGVQEVTYKDGIANESTAVTNMALGTAIALENFNGRALAHLIGDTAGTADAINISIADSGSISNMAVFGTIDEQANNFESVYEIVNITTGGTQESFLGIQSAGTEQLVIDGTQRVTLAENFAFDELMSVDASGMTGGGVNVLAFSATDANFSFMGSMADDRLSVSNSLLATGTGLSLDGGDGTGDILAIDDFGSVDVAAVNASSNFEVLEAELTITDFDADAFTIDTFRFSGDTGNAVIEITDVESDDTFIFDSDLTGPDEYLRFEPTGLGQALNLEFEAQAGAGGQVELTGTGDVFRLEGSTTFSEINIVSSGNNAEANLIAGFPGFDAFESIDSGLQFTITGSQDLTISAAEGYTLNNGSEGFENEVIVDASAFTGVLRLAGSNNNDLITGGSGDDVLYGLEGEDQVTGGAGADQFRLADTSPGASDTNSLTDFTVGEDKIGFVTGSFGDTTATTDGNAVSASDYVDNLQFISNMSGADDFKLVELQNAATQAQITQTTSAGSTDAFIVVFNSSSSQGEIWYDDDWSDAAARVKVFELENFNDVTDVTGLARTDFVEFLF